MPEAVYRMMAVLCALVGGVPVGTNLGLLHLLWMLASGRLLAAKQMLGASRQFVSAPETCQRLPELALLAGVA